MMSIEWLICFLVGIALGYAWRSLGAAQEREWLAESIAHVVAGVRANVRLVRGLHQVRDTLLAIASMAPGTPAGEAAHRAVRNLPAIPSLDEIQRAERRVNEQTRRLHERQSRQ